MKFIKWGIIPADSEVESLIVREPNAPWFRAMQRPVEDIADQSDAAPAFIVSRGEPRPTVYVKAGKPFTEAEAIITRRSAKRFKRPKHA